MIAEGEVLRSVNPVQQPFRRRDASLADASAYEGEL
jgi:hypothetical protein